MQVAPPPIPPHQQYSYAMNTLQQRQPTSQSTANNVSAASRKRKRVVKPVDNFTYRVQHSPSNGREYIVIDDDSPPPEPTPTHNLPPGLAPTVSSVFTGNGVRTRAQAAAAASIVSSIPPSVNSSVASVLPASKRRKKETFADTTPKATPTAISNGIAGASNGAHARKAIAGRAYENHKGNGNTWMSQASGGTESVRASQASAASTQVPQPPAPPSYDDKDGYYIIKKEDMIGNRYRIDKQLGQGTFGKVVEAMDMRTMSKVAVKIIRAIPKYRDASKIEIRVLQTLKRRDPINTNKCIHLLEWFDFRNHICIVTELLGLCIYDFLKENEFQPFPRRHIQDFAKQLLQSVAFLHDLGLIHTDLKPENILLVNSDHYSINVSASAHSRRAPRSKNILRNTSVRLIDFGSATFDEEYHPTVVSTRHYRAPEIILGLGWSFPCDAFSVGCILVEFYTGVALFQTHDNLEHLAMMEAVMGRMPTELAKAAYHTKREFFRGSYGMPMLDFPRSKSTKQSRKDVRATKSLEEIIKPMDVANTRFLDLVKQLLMWETNERIKVRDALTHPYFDIVIPLEREQVAEF